MQWLIDLVAKRVIATIGIPPVYINRGDPGDADFTLPNFTTDNAWHELDLSAIVPENAKAIAANANVVTDNVGISFRIRRHGNTNAVVTSNLKTQVASVEIVADFTCAIDADRKIDYRAGNVDYFVLSLSIKGWWL